MSYELKLGRSADTYYQRLDQPTRARIEERFEALAANPFGSSKSLKGKSGLRSCRVGNLRLILRVEEEASIVRIVAIGPRGQVYRNL